MSSQEHENRNWQRFAVERGKVQLRVSDRTCYHATIRDDSYGGLGVEINTESCNVKPGQRVWVLIPEGTLTAFVRFVLQVSANQWQLGLEWEKPGTFRAGATPWISGDEPPTTDSEPS